MRSSAETPLNLSGERGRRWLLALSTTAYSLGVGIAASTLWISPTPAGRLPGFMSAVGLDGRGPLRGILTILFITAILPIILNRFLRPLTAPSTKKWAFLTCAAALVSALTFALIDAFELVWVIFPSVAVLALCYTRRERSARFTAADLILIPVAVSLFLTASDLLPWLPFAGRVSIATIVLLLLRLTLSEIPSQASPASFFVIAPCALLFQARFFESSLIGGPVAAALIALAGPVILAFIFRNDTRWEFRARRLAMYVIYPLIAVTYPMLHDSSGAAGHLVVNFFEEGHSLLPASEMLRGERPYVDIVPGHGLISDGLLDLLAVKLGASDIGAVLRFRAAIVILFPLTIYLVALAVTGSPHAGMLAVLYASALPAAGTPYIRVIDALHGLPWLRAMPALFALAFAASAVRLRKTRHFAICGALLVLSVLTGIEFAFYSTLAASLAAFRFSRFWRGRGLAFRNLCAGVAFMAVPVALVFALSGFLTDSIRVTLSEVLPLSEVYAVGFFQFPDSLSSSRSFPEAVRLLFSPRAFWIVGWALAVVLTFSALSLDPLASRRRTDPLCIIGFWIALASISHAERLYAYYLPLLAVFMLSGAALLWRHTRFRYLALPATILVLLFIEPTAHLMKIASTRQQRVADSRDLVRYEALPRARGAFYRRDNIEKFVAVKAFVDLHLRPGETFFDFANMPILYYLLERPCPIRQYEVPFFEPEHLQREVIALLEHDRTVRAALIVFPNHGETSIDGVPNPVRTPLVWQYLREHFHPAYQSNGVVFWMRND